MRQPGFDLEIPKSHAGEPVQLTFAEVDAIGNRHGNICKFASTGGHLGRRNDDGPGRTVHFRPGPLLGHCNPLRDRWFRGQQRSRRPSTIGAVLRSGSRSDAHRARPRNPAGADTSRTPLAPNGGTLLEEVNGLVMKECVQERVPGSCAGAFAEVISVFLEIDALCQLNMLRGAWICRGTGRGG